MGLTTAFETRQFFFQRSTLSGRGGLDLALGLDDTRVQGPSGVRVAGHCGVTEHGFWARRGHHHIGRLARLGVNNWITQIIEMALDCFVRDLVIGDRSLQLAVPVDQAIPTKNQTVLEHAEERPTHRARADVVHGEALAIPVTRATHRLLLADDAFLILILPLPDALHQALASDVVTRFALELEQTFFDHGLGRNTSVIRAGHPQRVVAQHAMPANQQVFHDVIHGMPHVQGPGHVG